MTPRGTTRMQPHIEDTTKAQCKHQNTNLLFSCRIASKHFLKPEKCTVLQRHCSSAFKYLHRCSFTVSNPAFRRTVRNHNTLYLVNIVKVISFIFLPTKLTKFGLYKRVCNLVQLIQLTEKKELSTCASVKQVSFVWLKIRQNFLGPNIRL